MPELKPDIASLDRFLSGNASSSEKRRIEAWLATDPKATDTISLLKTGGLTAEEIESQWHSSAHWTDIREAMGSSSSVAVAGVDDTATAASARNGWWRNISRMAPQIAITAAAVALFGYTGVSISRYNATSTWGNRVYATAEGQRATVTLPDGTIATLAPATTLRVNNDVVELSGEALFTVTHSAGTPFIVRTGNIDTRVLGTTFGVRRYVTDSFTHVTVAEGRVAVYETSVAHGSNRDFSKSTVLSNGDFAVVHPNGSIEVTHDAERVLASLAFAQGRLLFDGATLGDAVPAISRWLNLKITVDSSASWRPFSATFHHETPAQVLDMIATLTQTTYVMNNNVVVFTGRSNR